MRFLRLPAVRSQDNDTAFTIVELLVVVLVIGILAAIAIPTFLGQQHRARDRSAQSDLRNALMAAKTLVVDHEGDYSKIGDDNDLVGGLRGIEPALDFEVLPVANYGTDPDTESVYVTIEGDSFVGVRVSESGRVFCVVDSRDATFLGEADDADDPDDPTDCTPLEGEEAAAGETTTTTSTSSTTTTTTVTTLPEEPVGVTSVSAGEDHTCAAIDGKAYCWGGESNRRVSGWNASSSVTEVPAPVEVKVEGTPLEGKLVSKVGAGRYFSCALAEGDVFCWGLPPGTGNGVGENNAQVVVAVEETWGGAVVTDLEVGAYSACAIAGGELYCWGVDKGGNLGLGTDANQQLSQTIPRHIELPGTVTSVGASSSLSNNLPSGYHTCAVAAGVLYCWGHNEYGKLGVGSEVTYSQEPRRVDVAGKEVSSVSAGTDHTCAVAEGDVYCWGRGLRGVIGNGSLVDVSYYTPQKVSFFDDKTVVAVDASYRNTCAITSAGELYCWGDSRVLGVQGPAGVAIPVLIGEGTEMEGKAVSAVTGGYSSNPHLCAIAENMLFCWGFDTYGKLGNGPGAGSSSYPTLVLSPS